MSSSGFDLDALKKKGYCHPFTHSPVLQDYVSQLMPSLQEVAGWGGQLLMLPVQLFIEVPGYYPDRFEKFGA